MSGDALSLYVNAGGFKTHTYAGGAGAGLPVVFVHGGGLGSSAKSWLATMQTVGRHRPVYAPDTVGFGFSAAPPIAYTTQTILDHLIAFCDVFCLERVLLVGHSLGATIVARLAVALPERVAGCVMVAPGGGAVGVKYHSAGHDAMARMLADPAPANVRALTALMRGNDEHIEEDTAARLALANRPGHLDALRAYAAAPPAATLEDCLPRLKTPLMLVWGMRERFNPPDTGARIAAKLPNLTRYVVFENAGHYIQYDEPDRFPETLNDFFAEVEVA